MSGTIQAFTCPACGGPLKYGTQSGQLECEYCGSVYPREQFEQAPAAEQPVSMSSYSCPACGAEMIADENTAAACCPYCGNQTVVPGRFAGTFHPDYIIPFKIDRKQALAALKQHYVGKKLLPSSFVEGNHIENVQGVYVPFWMFDCQSSGTMQFEASSSTKCRQGNEDVTVTKHFDVFRAGTLEFEKIPSDASTRMPDSHMDSIEPYDYSDLQPFSMTCMPGFLAETYDVEAADCMNRIRSRCEQTLEEELKKTVTGYDSVQVTGKNLQTASARPAYALMPVWLLATKWNGENFLFAMNGQTGRLVGDLPMDKGKYWKYFFLILVILEAVMAVIVFLMKIKSTVLLVLLFGLPVLIAWLMVSNMKGELHTVHPQQASEYITGRGLQLQGRDDRYVWTSEQRTPVQTSNQKA